MADSKRFFWLRLKRDFFKRHDMTIIEAMPNGKEYVLLYLKLLLESVDHEGALRFSDEIPYTEAMLAAVTNNNVDVVRSALKLFSDLKLIAYTEDGTLYMTEAEKHIGSESQWAEKKRVQRAKEDNVLALSSSCPECVPELSDKSKSIEYRERDIEKDLYTTTTTTAPAMTEVYVYFKSMSVEDAPKEAEKFHAYNANKGWSCLPDWKATADLWIARIEEKGRV